MDRNPEFPFAGPDRDASAPPKGRQRKQALRQIGVQLTYLGYTVERKLPKHDDERPVYYASHPRKDRPRLSYSEPAPGVVLFTARFTCKAKVTAGTGAYFNRANENMFVVKAYYETGGDGGMEYCVEAAYCGEYSKAQFSHFHDMFQTDLRRFHGFKGNERIIFGKDDAQEPGRNGPE